jgi:hypothetical protein
MSEIEAPIIGPGDRGPRRRSLGIDRWTGLGIAIVLTYLLIALGVVLGWWAGDWAAISDRRWAPPSSEHWHVKGVSPHASRADASYFCVDKSNQKCFSRNGARPAAGFPAMLGASGVR